VLAALCCALPPLLGVLGLSGLAGVVGSMPFTYHLVLQWMVLGLILFTWGWFGWKWTRMNQDNRRSYWTIVTGIILVIVTLYLVKNWYAHIFLMG